MGELVAQVRSPKANSSQETRDPKGLDIESSGEGPSPAILPPSKEAGDNRAILPASPPTTQQAIEMHLGTLRDIPYTPDNAQRKAAASQIVKIGVDALPALLEATKDVNEGVRIGSTYAIGKILMRTHGQRVIAESKSPSDPHQLESTQNEMNRAKQIVADPAFIPTLITCLKDESAVVRGNAASSIAATAQWFLPDKAALNAAVPDLIKATEDKEAVLRRIAFFALESLGPVAIEALPAIKRAMSQDPDEQARKNAADALKAIKP